MVDNGCGTWFNIYMTTTNRPELTSEIVAQLRAFNTGDIYAVTITRDVKSRAGNIIIAKGAETWGMTDSEFNGMHVWTGHTHYAGCKSSVVPNRSVKVDMVPA